MAAPKKKTAPSTKKTPAKKKASKKATIPGAGAQVDAALKARWEEAIARFRKARTEETHGWDARYEALGDILESEPPYYLAGGYKSVAAFLKAEVPDQDERTVRMYIRVARYFDPDDEAQFGVAKLDLLLRYLEVAGRVPLAPAKIRPDQQTIRLPDGKKTKTLSLADATANDLREAARAAARNAGKPGPTPSPAVRALTKVLASAKLPEASVRVRKGNVDLLGIPWSKLAALGKALAQAKLPPA